MTDKEKIEKAYERVRVNHPHVVNKQEIDRLAIGYERRRSLLCCLGLLAGAAVCFLLMGVLKESFEDTRYVLLVTGGFSIVEMIRTLIKLSRIEKLFHPTEQISFQGILTQDRILQDGKKLLKKHGGQFVILMMPLFDKEDETDVGFDNVMTHSYRFCFRRVDLGYHMDLRVSRKDYMEATLGAMYYVVVAPGNVPVAAYQASRWRLDRNLMPYFRQLSGQNIPHP